MADTKIEWADKTWNPVTGCSPISEGCQNCYAERMANRLKGRYGYPKENPFQITYHESRLKDPLMWKKPSRVFVCSMGDLFHEDVPDEWIDRVFAVMALCSQHIFIVLTKRPERMRTYIQALDEYDLEETDEWREAEYRVNCDDDPDGSDAWHRETAKLENAIFLAKRSLRESCCLPNVWLGVTAENQQRADERIPLLLQTPAVKRFVSLEPILGPVNLRQIDTDIKNVTINSLTGIPYDWDYEAWQPEDRIDSKIDWVICGGETGPGARPTEQEWIGDVYEQAKDANVPFFFKSWGSNTEPKDEPKYIDVQTCREFPKGG